MLHLRPFDWLLLLFCAVVAIRSLMPSSSTRGPFDIAVALMVLMLALYLIADVVLR